MSQPLEKIVLAYAQTPSGGKENRLTPSKAPEPDDALPSPGENLRWIKDKSGLIIGIVNGNAPMTKLDRRIDKFIEVLAEVLDSPELRKTVSVAGKEPEKAQSAKSPNSSRATVH